MLDHYDTINGSIILFDPTGQTGYRPLNPTDYTVLELLQDVSLNSRASSDETSTEDEYYLERFTEPLISLDL